MVWATILSHLGEPQHVGTAVCEGLGVKGATLTLC